MPAIIITGVLFIVWDAWFTALGVWEFNPDYLIGPAIWGLPIEEWMFFFTVPYAVVFIYECLKVYWKKGINFTVGRNLTAFFLVLMCILAITQVDRLYTFVTALGLAGVLGGIWVGKKMEIMRHFFPAYFISLLPFFVVNGLLTGIPVVIYNPVEQLDIRLGSIPIEDAGYGMLLFLINVIIYEGLNGRITRE